MDFLLRCAVLALASVGAAALVSSIVIALTWRPPAGTASQRADRLWRLRLLPLAVALGACAFTAIGLWRFEARQSDEVLGWIVRGGATLGALFLVGFGVRLLQMHRDTRRLLRAWLSGATRIDLPELAGVPAFRIHTHYPVVAVVGIVRPTLVMDASVLDACSPAELSAILAHEQGHLRRWDNLRRALFAASPDLLAWTRVGPALRDAWREATEEAADDVAAERGDEARLHLARALVRVARLGQDVATQSPSPFRAEALPASALYRGDSIERRVRRLLDPAEAGAPAPRAWGVTALAAAVAALAFSVQQEMHHLMELAVNGLW